MLLFLLVPDVVSSVADRLESAIHSRGPGNVSLSNAIGFSFLTAECSQCPDINLKHWFR